MNEKQEMTLQEAVQYYLDALQVKGKSPRTVYTYNKDCEQIVAFFGPEKKLCNILPAHVAKFYKSDELLIIPKNRKVRALRTVNKTRMVLRGLLTWAVEEGHIPHLPLPKAK